jgi:hypothetical protein
MGVAYLAQAAGTMLTGGKPVEAFTAVQQGMHSLEHALELNPDHAEALATHGGVQAMMASFQQQPQLAAKGVADMNRAVNLAPNSVRVRLVRAFNGLSLPDALRSNAAAATEATARLTALAQGGVPATDIKKLRIAAGANCVMCHGK